MNCSSSIIFFYMILRPPIYPLFPYTTLFRSLILGSIAERAKFSAVLIFLGLWFTFSYLPVAHMVWFFPGPDAFVDAKTADARSEEHTSELQSRRDLVCRLLLDKKKYHSQPLN